MITERILNYNSLWTNQITLRPEVFLLLGVHTQLFFSRSSSFICRCAPCRCCGPLFGHKISRFFRVQEIKYFVLGERSVRVGAFFLRHFALRHPLLFPSFLLLFFYCRLLPKVKVYRILITLSNVFFFVRERKVWKWVGVQGNTWCNSIYFYLFWTFVGFASSSGIDEGHVWIFPIIVILFL